MLCCRGHGRFSCALIFETAGALEERKMHARGIWTCFGLLEVVFESPVLGVGVRLIHRHIREPSLGLLFVHRVRKRGALRADRCRNSLRSPLLRRLVLYGVGIDKPVN